MGINVQRKSAQAFSLEVIGALVVFLLVVVFFYGLITLRTTDTSLKREAERVSNKIPTLTYFSYPEITSMTLTDFSSNNYTSLKRLLGTDAEVCIYFKDPSGNLIPLPNNNITLGCPGVNVTAWQR